MKELRFYGSGDDLFEIRGSSDKDGIEIGCHDRACNVRVLNDKTGLIVTGIYSPAHNGCWTIGISILDEDRPLPDWYMGYKVAENGYSVELVMNVPDDVVVEEVPNDR
jgi:hypothetical protein